MKCSHLVNKGWRRDVESVGRKHKTDLKKGLKTNDLKYDIGTHEERYEWEVKIRVKKKKTPNNYIFGPILNSSHRKLKIFMESY